MAAVAAAPAGPEYFSSEETLQRWETHLFENRDAGFHRFFGINRKKNQDDFKKLLETMQSHLHDDLKTVLKEFQDKKLTVREEKFLIKFYNDNLDLFPKSKPMVKTPITQNAFVEAALIYSTIPLIEETKIEKGVEEKKLVNTLFKKRKEENVDVVSFLAITIRIASYISKDNTVSRSVHYVNACVLALFYIIHTRQVCIKNVVDHPKTSEWYPVAKSFCLNKSMFPWFEDAFLSWGLNMTREGLTWNVETVPGHTIINEFTSHNKSLWEEFASNSKNVVTFAMIACLAEYGRSMDYSSNGLEEWGSWDLSDHAYLFFINSPLLKKHSNYKDVLTYLEMSRKRTKKIAQQKNKELSDARVFLEKYV